MECARDDTCPQSASIIARWRRNLSMVRKEWRATHQSCLYHRLGFLSMYNVRGTAKVQCGRAVCQLWVYKSGRQQL